MFYRNGIDVISDCGMVVLDGDTPYIMQFRPFRGFDLISLPQYTDAELARAEGAPYYEVFRYVGRRDNQKSDFEVATDAALWFKKWRKYRYAAHLWIFLSRLPILKHWIKGNCDLSKVQANYGFITSTAIAWAYECAGVDLVPNRSPDVTSLGDLTRCALLKKIM